MALPPDSPIAAGSPSVRLRPLPSFIFMSRWLQLPLYLGLIVAQGVYVYHFLTELVHLIQAAFGSATALMVSIGCSRPSSAPTRPTSRC